MRETVLPDGRRRLVYDYRGPDGPAHVQTTLPAGMSIADRIKAKAALVEKAERRSLKDQEARFEDMVDAVLKRNNGAGMQWVYDRIKRDLAGPINNGFAHRYNRYLDTLLAEEKTVNTISNHKSAIRRVLNFAYKRHSIESMPIRDFEIKAKFRSRVLSRDERNRLEDAMRGMKDGRRLPGVPVSYMYWSIRFAERRPIRGLSDLWNLTRENLVLIGEGAPYIKMAAQKTELATVFPLLDMPDILEYFKYALPQDCPYLFPRLVGAIDSPDDFTAFQASRWYKINNPKHEWERLLDAAEIDDFHFHDLKRMATTEMLDGVYTAEKLIDLGIYASRKMIDLCYKKRNAMTVLKWLSTEMCSDSVAVDSATNPQKQANS